MVLLKMRTRKKYVYAFFSKVRNQIKIGTSGRLKDRLRCLKTSNPDGILIGKIPGSFVLEKQIHKMFSGLKYKREWFKNSKKIFSFFKGSKKKMVNTVKTSVIYAINDNNIIIQNSKEPSPNWNICDWENYRKEQYNAAKKLLIILDNNNRAQLVGALKIGKRDVIECFSRLIGDADKVMYLTSLNRNDMKVQFTELRTYGIDAECISSKNKTKEEKIRKQIISSKGKVYIFFDENDYGDGQDQTFCNFFDSLKDNQNIKWIFVSATPFSLLLNLDNFKMTGDNISIIQYPKEYNGIGNIKNITVSTDAYKNNQISQELFQCILDFIKQDSKTRMIVRVINGFDKYSFLNDFIKKCKDILDDNKFNEIKKLISNDFFKEVNEKNSSDHKWKYEENSLIKKPSTKNFSDNHFNDQEIDSIAKDLYFSGLKESKRVFFVKQTFSRGTETDWHEYIYAYYDCRGTNLNTLVQAIGRFAGYKDNSEIKLFVSESGKEALKVYENIYNILLSDDLIGGISDDTIDRIIESSNYSSYSDKIKITFAVKHKGTFSHVGTHNAEDGVPKALINYDELTTVLRAFIGIDKLSCPSRHFNKLKLYEYGFIKFDYLKILELINDDYKWSTLSQNYGFNKDKAISIANKYKDFPYIKVTRTSEPGSYSVLKNTSLYANKQIV